MVAAIIIVIVGVRRWERAVLRRAVHQSVAEKVFLRNLNFVLDHEELVR